MLMKWNYLITFLNSFVLHPLTSALGINFGNDIWLIHLCLPYFGPIRGNYWEHGAYVGNTQDNPLMNCKVKMVFLLGYGRKGVKDYGLS